MKPIIFVLLVTVIGLISCKGKNKTSSKDTVEAVQYTAKDSAEIRTVITGFYNWYNKNYKRLLDWPFITEAMGDKFVRTLNWDAVERSQQFIRDSVPQLGEEFLKNQKRFFQQCDSAFKKDTEEGVPYGFDYDWYTNSQEDPQYLVDQINKASSWGITLADNYAKVQIKSEYETNGKTMEEIFLIITMKKENGKWTIAKIGDNY